MAESGVSACEGCGLILPVSDGSAHAYIGASAACWALFGEVLAREFGDPEYFRLHQLTVDAYAAQHPGGSDRRAVQSVALHLVTLCLVVEGGADPSAGPRLHQLLATRVPFHRLDPPSAKGRLTIADVREAGTPTEHERGVEAWARDVWAAWEPHHATVRAWIERALPR